MGHGKYSESAENMKGKMLISVLILSVFVVGAGILLFTSPAEADIQYPGDDSDISGMEEDIQTFLPLEPIDPTPTPVPTPPPPPPIQITDIFITYGGSRNDDFTVGRDQSVGVRLHVDPPNVDLSNYRVEWESSDPEVFGVVATITDPGTTWRGADVRGITNGDENLTVTVRDLGGEVVAYHTIIVRVRGG